MIHHRNLVGEAFENFVRWHRFKEAIACPETWVIALAVVYLTARILFS